MKKKHLLISAAVIFVLIYTQKNLMFQVKNNFLAINWSYLSLAVLVFILSSLFATMRIALLAWANNIRISFLILLKNLYVGFLFNPILMGTTGGDLVRSYYLTKQTGKKTEIVTMVFIDRFIGVFVLGSLAITVILFNFDNPKLKTILSGAIIVYLGMISAALLFSSRRVVKKFAFLNRFFRKSKLKEIAKKAFDTLHTTKKYKKTLLMTAFFTLLFQCTLILSCWLASKALTGVSTIPIHYFYLFLPIIFTVSSLPISPGGIGVGEAAYATLFALVGVSEADAISISLMNRFILMLASFAGGCIYLLPSTEKVDIENLES